MDTAYYFIPFVLFLIGYAMLQRRRQKRTARVRQEARETGLGEPTSLHPLIDRNKCIGCKSCVYICPQQLGHNVLGIFHGKAELLEPANCIGHGACKKVCPEDAITLVFGSERRGVDIPQVDDKFETNIPGIYIAGELGGMGLIRNAIEQGKTAMKSIIEDMPKNSTNPYQILIVGAGPAGISATLAAQQANLKYVTVDQESLGGTVFQYPRGKIVMTQPVELPMVGKMHFKETTKETLLEYWTGVESQTGIKIQYGELVAKIEQQPNGFKVTTSKGEYQTDKILLAIGRRGTPRKLNIPGEDLPKVVYRLIDPEQYRGQKVMIVGGGDSALEAAMAISDEEGTKVSISYRSDSFARAKAKNRERLDERVQAGKIDLYLSTNPVSISEDSITVNDGNQDIEVPNDAVIINAGGILPTGFLKQIGINVETKYGTA